MNHIRFLTTNDTVCEKPQQLGNDFVLIDYNEGKSCDRCLLLILTFNERERKYDLLVELPKQTNPSSAPEGTWRTDWVYPLILSSAVWILVIVLYYVIFHLN